VRAKSIIITTVTEPKLAMAEIPSRTSQKPPAWATAVVPLSDVAGDTPEETSLLLDLAERAERYLTSFRWCQSVREIYYGEGIGKIVGLFLCRIVPCENGVDEWLWVIVGDVPSAYLVTDACKNPAEAFDTYTEEMSKWIELAREGKSSQSVIPVNAPATPEEAERLRLRLELIGQLLRPWLDPPPRKCD
jgi:hypothetical protein